MSHTYDYHDLVALIMDPYGLGIPPAILAFNVYHGSYIYPTSGILSASLTILEFISPIYTKESSFKKDKRESNFTRAFPTILAYR